MQPVCIYIDNAWKPPPSRKKERERGRERDLFSRQPYTRRIFCLSFKFNRIATTFTCQVVRVSRYAKPRREDERKKILPSPPPLSLLSLWRGSPLLDSRFSSREKFGESCQGETERIDKATVSRSKNFFPPPSGFRRREIFGFPLSGASSGIRRAVSASANNFPSRICQTRAHPDSYATAVASTYRDAKDRRPKSGENQRKLRGKNPKTAKSQFFKFNIFIKFFFSMKRELFETLEY